MSKSAFILNVPSPLPSSAETVLGLAFVAAKSGFANPAAAAYIGEVYVVDIGAPRILVEEVLARAAHGTR